MLNDVDVTGSAIGIYSYYYEFFISFRELIENV